MSLSFLPAQLNASLWPKRWLWLGIWSLAIAGVFSVVLVMARTPQLSMFTNLFSVSLVIHVDLSVLVWFLAIAGLGWSYSANAHTKPLQYFQATGFWVSALGTALIALSPIDPHWEVIKSNYIPVLNNPLFLGGLSLLMAGMVVAVLPIILRSPSVEKTSHGLMHRAIYWGAWIVAVALAAFAASAAQADYTMPLDYRFETLFWAGGHILQFAYTQIAMIAWLVLLTAIGCAVSVRSNTLIEWVMPMGMIASFLSVVAFLLYPVGSAEFTQFFTHKMIYLGGIAPTIIGGIIIVALIKMGKTPRDVRALKSILVMSLILFASGGFIAFLIQGQNVTIPAHYHGSIVGVTLALMGLTYVLLPIFGYKPVASWRLAFWQPILYGGGQLLHVGGLAYSGGYGVLRKYTGELPMEVKAAMGVMGLGGMLAIIGGLLFVIVVIKSARKAHQ